jgi:hypothetical protein
MRHLRRHSLLYANLLLFLVFFGSMIASGWATYNHDQLLHGESATSLTGYLTTGDFMEATFENWESEFLQMGMYVVLTARLLMVGSSESRPPEGETPQDEDPRLHRDDPKAPWPVRRGGLPLRLYEHSLSAAFFILFLLSVLLHGIGGASAYNEEQLAHGAATVSTLGYFGTSQFWFESFQNWQSEFLAVALIVGLSVFLRERGSTESKPVFTPHDEQGD